jgi:hypothetical protein
MTYGIKALRKAQGGLETTAGTAKAATFIWPGEAGWITDEGTQEPVAEDDGNFLPSARVHCPRLGATWAMPETVATFETLPVVFAAGIENITSATTDTGGSGHIYQYDVGTSAARTVATFTFEVGNNVDVSEMEYSFVEEFTLSGAEGEGLMFSAGWRGRQKTDTTFTAAQAKITGLEEIPFSIGAIYIDATTVGTTQKTGTWKGFSLTQVTGFKALWTGDGNASPYFSTIKQDPPELTGEFTFEHDATGLAEIEAAEAGTTRLIRLIWEGSTLTTAGSSYTKKTLKIDLAVQYTAIPDVDEDDGDDVVTLPWRAVQGTDPQYIVVNQHAEIDA